MFEDDDDDGTNYHLIKWSNLLIAFFFVSSVCRARSQKKTDQIGELAGAILFLCTHKLMPAIKGKRLTANETCFRLIYILFFSSSSYIIAYWSEHARSPHHHSYNKAKKRRPAVCENLPIYDGRGWLNCSSEKQPS